MLTVDFADNDSTTTNYSIAESRDNSTEQEANVINAATNVTIIYLVIGVLCFYISDICSSLSVNNPQ